MVMLRKGGEGARERVGLWVRTRAVENIRILKLKKTQGGVVFAIKIWLNNLVF